jgi:hypothetical protein
MAIKWTKIEETSTVGYMPTIATNTWNTGINAPGGPIEFLTLRYDLNFTVEAPAISPVLNGDISSLIQGLRVVLNGEVVHDFQAGYSGGGTTGPSQYNYLLNHTGGRCVEVCKPDAALSRQGFINIPLGRQTPAGVNRYEITVDWAAADGTIESGSLSWWLRMNDGMEKTTTVVPATSFLSSVSQEQVVVRVPQNVPGVVSALLVLNDAETDGFGSQGIRINALSDFGIGASQYRMTNGDLMNGLMWNKGNTQDTLSFSTRLSGALLIPVFGLTGGDIVLSVDSSEATTRRYIPIITNPVGASTKPDVRQTQSQRSNTAKAILKGSLD